VTANDSPIHLASPATADDLPSSNKYTNNVIQKLNYYRQYSAKLKEVVSMIKKQRNMPKAPVKTNPPPLPTIQPVKQLKHQPFISTSTTKKESINKIKKVSSKAAVGYLSGRLALIRHNYEVVTRWRERLDELQNNEALWEYAMSRSLADFKSVAQLVSFFRQCVNSGCARTSVELAWCIYVWMAHNIDFDAAGYKVKRYEYISPDSVLKSGRAVCSGFASLYAHLCMHCKVPCLNVSGHVKPAGFRAGVDSLGGMDTEHAWNAVKLDGKW
jgi:transglutaminase/protease-like cytokinesis protein 3